MQDAAHISGQETLPNSFEAPAQPLYTAVGLPVRTNLRAGITLEEVGDQLSDWWSSVTSSVSSVLGGDSTE